MESVFARLTVCFEDPFWVGVYERWENNRLSVSRIVFGAEPKDYEVYAYLLAAWNHMRFSPAVTARVPPQQSGNPKRRQRAIRRALERPVGSTKAQQALQAEKERKFQLKQQKKKQKRRGG